MLTVEGKKEEKKEGKEKKEGEEWMETRQIFRQVLYSSHQV